MRADRRSALLARLGALPPVTGPPFVMSYRDNDDLCGASSVIDAERKPRKNEPPRSMFRYWIPHRRFGNLRNGLINLLCKCRSAHGAAFLVPSACPFEFRACSRMKPNLHCAVQTVPRGRLPMGWFRPFPRPIPQPAAPLPATKLLRRQVRCQDREFRSRGQPASPGPAPATVPPHEKVH